MSRQSFIPELIYPYLGDVLYALMIYFVFAFIFPSMSSVKVALLSIGLCVLIEISQLYQADWINAIRNTRLGGLVLGFGFRWSDWICYSLGGVLGWLLERFFLRRSTEH